MDTKNLEKVETVWIAVLKARGVNPSKAMEHVRKGAKEGVGLVFCGPSGMLALVQADDLGLPLRVVRPEPAEHPWVTASRLADLTTVVWDDSEALGYEPLRTIAIEEKRALNVVKPCGRISRYRDGELQYRPADVEKALSPCGT